MAVNRFYKRTPYDIGLYVPPIAVMEQTLQMAQKQYDLNSNAADQIKDNFIPSLPQDRQKANEIQKQWSDQVDGIVKKYGGDYSQAGKELNALLRTIKKEYNPGGTANAITNNYATYNDWKTRHQERVKSGKVLGEDMNLANNYIMGNYQGIGEIDPVTGAYSQIGVEDLTDYADPEKIIRETYSTFKEEKHKIGKTTVRDDGFLEYNEVETEGITAQRLNPSFQNALAADPQLRGYYAQKLRFSGKDPALANQFLEAYATQRANNLAYMNDSQTSKLDANPFAVARLKASLDKKNMMEVAQSFMQYGEAADGTIVTPNSQINHDNWRQDLSLEALNQPGAFPISLGGFSIDSEAGARQTAAMGKIAPDSQTLTNFLADDKSVAKLQAKGVNVNLARAMWQEHGKQWGSEFSSKYGKDPAYTTAREKDFWYNYNKEARNHQSQQTFEMSIPEGAREQVMDNALRNAISKQASVYKVGSPVGSAGLDSTLENEIFDAKKGTFKTDGVQATYVYPGPGIPVAGVKISTRKGSFIVEDPNISRTGYGNMLAAGLNPIYFEGKSMGAAALPYAQDPKNPGTLLTGIPKLEYTYNPQTGRYDDNLVMYEPSDPSKPITQTVNGKTYRVTTTVDRIHDIMRPGISSALGYGMSDAKATPFNQFMNSMFSN